MKKIVGKTAIFGCSTAGEIVTGRMLKNSVVCMVFDAETIEDVKIEVMENIKANTDVRAAFNNFDAHFKIHMAYMDFDKYAGLVLIDGLSGMEEKLMESIASHTNLQFIGASAGDDIKHNATYVFADGSVYTKAALIVLLKIKSNFGFIKTQSFNILDKKMKATKVDESIREVIEFNNKPAIEAYSEALGITPEEAQLRFVTNPVGLVIDHELYVRSPRKVENESMLFYCNIKQGSELVLLESTDIIEDTRNALKTKLAASGKITGIINFNCIQRTLEMEEKNQIADYEKLFSDIPTIGFSTFGDELIYHINQTATMLVFK